MAGSAGARTQDAGEVASKKQTSTIKVEDERSMAMAGSAISFSTSGKVLTAPGEALNIPEESRNLCVLFESGLWLVSASHRHSPLVTSVAVMARRQGFKVDEPRYVTPNIINQAYLFADRQVPRRSSTKTLYAAKSSTCWKKL